jgi:glycine/D-amino acid oxidase-like deaminating enzyme
MRHTRHGYWLQEVGRTEPLAALSGDARADVVVIGGGYTGMWAAWWITELAPDARVLLLEADECGRGPSGRNGGFVNALSYSLPSMIDRFGVGGALAVARESREAVRGVGRWCEEQGVDAWYRRSGYLQVSTTPAHDDAWQSGVDAWRDHAEAEPCEALAPGEVRARCDSPLFRGGAFYPDAATVQPARLARGLRERLVERGVSMCERSAVVGINATGREVAVRTGSGRAVADSAVLAIGGRSSLVPPLHRRLTVTSSHIVITEPVPDVLEAIGWTGGECITDARAMVHYFRTTPDGRIAFGWGGGPVAPGNRIRGRVEVDPTVVAQVARHLIRFFPQLAGRRIEHAWGGPIDVSPTHLPVVGTLGRDRVHYAFGYTGNGVGPSHFVGRALASLTLDRRDRWTALPLVEPPAVLVPPEPFRFLGGTVVRRALLRKERIEEEGRRAGPLTRLVAGLPARLGIQIGR